MFVGTRPLKNDELIEMVAWLRSEVEGGIAEAGKPFDDAILDTLTRWERWATVGVHDQARESRIFLRFEQPDEATHFKLTWG